MINVGNSESPRRARSKQFDFKFQVESGPIKFRLFVFGLLIKFQLNHAKNLAKLREKRERERERNLSPCNLFLRTINHVLNWNDDKMMAPILFAAHILHFFTLPIWLVSTRPQAALVLFIFICKRFADVFSLLFIFFSFSMNGFFSYCVHAFVSFRYSNDIIALNLFSCLVPTPPIELLEYDLFYFWPIILFRSHP